MSWPPAVGMLIAMLAVSASTSRRPVGSLVMRIEPSMTRMPAASIFSLASGCGWPLASTPTSKTSVKVLEANWTGIVAAGVPGRLMISLIALPVRLMRTRSVPETVRPGRPTSSAAPQPEIAKVSSAGSGPLMYLTMPTVAFLITTPMAFGLTVPSSSRYGPSPRNSVTFVAP